MTDLVREPKNFDAMRQHARDLLHAGGEIDGFEDLLLLLRSDIHVGGRKIGERCRGGDTLDRSHQLRRSLRQKLNCFQRLLLEVNKACFDLGRRRLRLGDSQNSRDEERPAVEELGDLEALVALTNEMMRAVRRSHVANDVGHRAHPMHIDRRWIRNIAGTLHEDADLPLVPDCLLGRRNRLRPTHADRQHKSGKQDKAANRNDDEGVRGQWRQSRCPLIRALL